jgi:hypothetical protein
MTRSENHRAQEGDDKNRKSAGPFVHVTSTLTRTAAASLLRGYCRFVKFQFCKILMRLKMLDISPGEEFHGLQP